MTNETKRSVYFPEGYFPICKCNSCGEPYDPANGHICGRGPTRSGCANVNAITARTRSDD